MYCAHIPISLAARLRDKLELGKIMLFLNINAHCSFVIFEIFASGKLISFFQYFELPNQLNLDYSPPTPHPPPHTFLPPQLLQICKFKKPLQNHFRASDCLRLLRKFTFIAYAETSCFPRSCFL